MKGYMPIIVAGILLIAFLAIAGSQLVPKNMLASLIPADFSGNCLDVYCTDYEFQCCGIQKTGRTSYSSNCDLFSGCSEYKCTSVQCVVIQSNPIPSNYYPVSINRNGVVTQYQSLSFPVILYRGDSIKSTNINRVFEIDLYRLRLAWCGDAACDAGVTGITVWGTDDCTFVTDKSIYDKNGVLLQKPTSGQISYTVPHGECLLIAKGRTVCGNTCESCKSDSDCVAGHTYVYNGKGAECLTGLVEWYGCRQYGAQPNDFDLLPKETASYNYGSRCEVIGSQRVQCCPGGCGSNAVCDVNTFTCVQTQQAECSADWQCGTNQVYDQPTKQIRKPVCIIGHCDFQVVRTVQCYYNSECPEGWYCDNDYTCKQSSEPKTSCPYVCCIGDSRFFDKPCPPDKSVCCPDGQACAATMDECFASGHGEKAVNWFAVVIAAVLCTLLIIVLFIVIPPLRPFIGLLFPFGALIIFILFLILFASAALSVASLIASVIL